LPEIVDVTELPALKGRDLGSSRWWEVTQEQISTFDQLTGDEQWIHVDTERARTGPFGTTIAHGFLTLSLLSAMSATAFRVNDSRMGVNYGLNKVRFPAPVPVDSHVRGRFQLIGYEPLEGGAQIAVEATMERQNGIRPVCVAEWLSRWYW